MKTTVLFVLAGQYLLMVVALAQAPPTPTPGFFDGGGTAIGQILLFLTTLAGFIYTIYRENRNRRWDQEDRERAREEVRQEQAQRAKEMADQLNETRQQIAGTVEATRRELSGRSKADRRILEAKIDESAHAAATAAQKVTDVEQRIANLAATFLEGSDTPQLSRVEGMTSEMVTRMRAADHAITDAGSQLERVEQNTQEAVEILKREDDEESET